MLSRRVCQMEAHTPTAHPLVGSPLFSGVRASRGLDKWETRDLWSPLGWRQASRTAPACNFGLLLYTGAGVEGSQHQAHGSLRVVAPDDSMCHASVLQLILEGLDAEPCSVYCPFAGLTYQWVSAGVSEANT